MINLILIPASLCDEIGALSNRLETSNSDHVVVIRDFLPYAIKIFLGSDHFSVALVDLQHKAMLVGRART